MPDTRVMKVQASQLSTHPADVLVLADDRAWAERLRTLDDNAFRGILQPLPEPLLRDEDALSVGLLVGRVDREVGQGVRDGNVLRG